jgi:hypothetical protein
MPDATWNERLLEQLTWHWDHHVRPRLDGLSDAEYLWEPVPGCWNLHPQPDGTVTVDFVFPEPEPAPVTTIAWRLGHLIVGVFGHRNESHFGGRHIDYTDYEWQATAKEALDVLDEVYGTWVDGVRSLGDEGLSRRCGPAEGPFAEHTLADLVVHINREAIHHAAEVLTLRDLYRAAHAAPITVAGSGGRPHYRVA